MPKPGSWGAAAAEEEEEEEQEGEEPVTTEAPVLRSGSAFRLDDPGIFIFNNFLSDEGGSCDVVRRCGGGPRDCQPALVDGWGVLVVGDLDAPEPVPAQRAIGARKHAVDGAV